MAILVFIFTGNKDETYSSETVIYTGLATGYDIESGSDARYDFLATNAKFDNLINIIKSRKTLEETAIRLMTQHLMLEKPDLKFCLGETWDAIQEEAPREVKSLIHYQDNPFTGQGYDMPQDSILQDSDVESEKDSVEAPQTRWVTKTHMEIQQVTEKVRKVRSEPSYYTVKAGDYPVRIAGKYNISLEELKALNSADAFPIRGGQTLKVGSRDTEYFIDSLVEVEVPVDTLVEESIYVDSTPEELPIQNNPVILYDSISRNFDNIYDEALTKMQSYERSVANLIKYKEQDQSNYIYTTLQSSNKTYGVEKIAKVKVSRMQNSDLLKLSYESTDQGVCQQTLKIITAVFKKQFQSIQGAQTSMVSEYFRMQRDAAMFRLDSLEEYNKKYRLKHRIINYDEQTKSIAVQNEVLDQSWYMESATLSAAKAALYSLESQMDETSQNLIQRAELLDLKDDLSRLTHLISLEEVQPSPDIDVLSNHRVEKERVQSEMDDYLNYAFQSKRTPEGLNMKSVLDLWLSKLIEVEESRARYEVITKEKHDFGIKYDTLAPVGSTLTKIAREIGLAEKEYLNQTHNLDLSLTKQKSNEQSNISIIDEAYFPIKPNPSKRLFIVVAAFLAGLFLTGGTIILLEFLDTSIKYPERAEELTKNQLLGVFPRIPSKPDKQTNYPLIITRVIDMITQKIKLRELERSSSDRPFVIMFMSTRDQEGKTFFASKLVEKFRAIGHEVLYIKPVEDEKSSGFEEQFRKQKEENQLWDFEYEIPDNFMSVRSVNELLRDYTFITRGYHYIFIELPALLSADYPSTLAAGADLSLLITRATRSWNKADDKVLDVYKDNTKQTVFTVLNGARVESLEEIIGEIPKEQNFIQKLIDKVINFDFNFSKGF